MAKNTKTDLPYANFGPVASLPNFGIDPAALGQLLAGKALVSFDVFDTLLARSVIEPPDVFDLLGHRHGIAGFREARIGAEAAARRNGDPSGNAETSLEEIHDQLAAFARLPANAAEHELEAERTFLYANPPGVAALGIARALGKRVVAITDMYLSASQVDALLKHCGIDVDRFYSSSDLRREHLGKFNGRMFAHVAVAEGVSPDQIIHIGDNYRSDVENAWSAGLAALHIDQNIDVARRLMPDFGRLLPAKAENFSHSAVVGAVLKLTAAAPAACSPASAFRFGYVYGGPLVVGFLRHVLDDARARGIGHLNLLARDGAVIEQALLALGVADVSFRLLPASRRMALFPRFADGGYPAIAALFAAYPNSISRRAFLEILGLEHILPASAEGAVMGSIEDHVTALADALHHQAAAEKAALARIYGPFCTEEGRIGRTAWVDVGWALRSAAALNELLGTQAPGYFVGSNDHAERSDGFSGYLFDYGSPADVCGKIMRAPELIELVFSDTALGTRYALERDGTIAFNRIEKGATETLRDAYVRDVRDGVLAFVHAIRPVFDHLNAEDLRAYNRRVWSDLCAYPNRAEYDHLGKVPHDQLSSGAAWRTIGQLWRPLGIRAAGANGQFEVPPDQGPVGLRDRLRALNRRRNEAMRRWRTALHRR